MGEGLPKKLSNIEKGARAAIAGAAFLGVVNATEASAGAAPLQNKIEVQESFDVNKEADAFIEKISAMSFPARGTYQTKIEIQFEVFALALQMRAPHFSEKSNRYIAGSVTSEIREQAKKILLSKLGDRDLKITPQDMQNGLHVEKRNLQLLKETLEPKSVISPELKKKLGDW